MTIEERLERLERALLGAAPSSADRSTSDIKFKSVEAERLIVRDENGVPRVMVCVTEGGPSLSLCGKDAEFRAGLALTHNMVGLGLKDEKGTFRAAFTGTDDDAAMLLETAIINGLRIADYHVEKQDIEDIFMEIGAREVS